MTMILNEDAAKALDTIAGWFPPILHQRRREKITRLAELLTIEKKGTQIDRAAVIESAKFVLHPGYAPRFKAMEAPPDRNAVKATYLDLDSYYAAERRVKRWDYAAPPTTKPAAEMKVLAFNASPRVGGTSDTLIDAALAGAVEAGASVEKINLSDLALKTCDNTLIQRDYFVARQKIADLKLPYCVHSKGLVDEQQKGECSLVDDIAEVYPKIVAADAVIIGFPVYNGWECSLLASFLERWDRYEACTKPVKNTPTRGMLIGTWGYLDTESYDHLLENLITKMNFRNIQAVEVIGACGVVGMLSGFDAEGESVLARFPAEMDKARQAGRTLVTGERGA
jgi:multimeric flavodoxin WrbA